MADDSETGIKIYLQEISGTPLLTVQEEIELAARIKKGDQNARAPSDRYEIEGAASKITMNDARYPEELEQLTNR